MEPAGTEGGAAPASAPGQRQRAHALAQYFPILEWGRSYNGAVLTRDLVAAVVVTIMLIPQSLAYALLAGLPPVVGLYASILPLVAYAIFGTSRTLAVGPVAVVSLMTASAAGAVAAQGTALYLEAAITLAALSGIMLAVLGLLRMGFLANLLSHPVISGFITASGILIATSQLKHILGVSAGGDTWPAMLGGIAAAIDQINPWTLAIGLPATLFLFWVRKGLKPLLVRLGLTQHAADIVAKAGPVAAVAATIVAALALDLGARGVNLVGAIPQGLPPFALPSTNPDLIAQLWVPALLISIIGFVESVSVAQTLAAKRRQRIAPNQELIGLGASNIASAFSGGYPVTGGFARSVVNFDAGAETPAAGAYTAVGIALAGLFLTPLLFSLPIATLAATIIVAVLSLVDLKTPGQLWRYSKADFAAHMVTIVITLLDPYRRKPDLSQRALARGICPRGSRRPARSAPRDPDVQRSERDRRFWPRKPRGDQSSPRRRRDRIAPVRSQGAGHGPVEPHRFRRRAQRPGVPVAEPRLSRACGQWRPARGAALRHGAGDDLMPRIPDKDARCRRIAALVAAGRGVCESCREIGISEKTFYRWRAERRSNATPLA